MRRRRIAALVAPAVMTLLPLLAAGGGDGGDGEGEGWDGNEDDGGLSFAQVARVQKLLCGSRNPCRASEIYEAGEDQSGNDLLVVEIALTDEEGDAWKGADPDACAPWEVWRAKWCAKGPCGAVRLAEICNDGYGASGIGEDTVEVDDNSLTLSRYGGSAWRWTEETTWRLDPLEVVAKSSGSFESAGYSDLTTIWDFDSRTGWVEWYSPECTEHGKADGSPVEGFFAFQPIPVIAPPAGYIEGGWRTTALGSCAARADATGTLGRGWTVMGEPGTAGDSSMRAAVVGDRTLVVMVEDDSWISGSGSWVTDDHVEVWTGAAFPIQAGCVEHQPIPIAWAIDLADGSMILANGESPYVLPPEPPQVERASISVDGRTAVILAITFASLPGRMTILYSDSDDGLAVERMTATSRLSFARPLSLGEAMPFPEPPPAESAMPVPGTTAAASCAVISGMLEFAP